MLLFLKALTFIMAFNPGESSKAEFSVALEGGGEIKGALITTPKARFQAFYGLPYAKPPIGKLRFMSPQSLPNEMEPMDASDPKLMSMCSQLSIDPGTGKQVTPVLGSEDCLKLSVFTPALESGWESEAAQLHPVIVYFHPGNFFSGSASSISPDKFFWAEDDLKIIFVTVNFRLGALGFLTLENKHLSGNQGFKDQILALEWIKRNIHHFGGDPNSVVLWGHSSGASSVLGHLISPKSMNLFNKVIVSSPTAFIRPVAKPGFAASKDQVAAGLEMVEGLGCGKHGDVGKVLECLQGADLTEIVQWNNKWEQLSGSGNPWNFIVDGVYMDDLVFPVGPKELLGKGKFRKVPMIVGATSDEGAIFIPQFFPTTKLQEFGSHFEQFGPHLAFGIDSDEITDEDSASIGILKTEYLSDGVDSEVSTVGNVKYLKNLLTDLKFLGPLDDLVKLIAKFNHKNLYYYSYRFKGSLTSTRNLLTLHPSAGASLDLGISHLDDHLILFNANATDSTNFEMGQKLVGIVKKFSHFSDPGCNWTPVQDGDIKYAILDNKETRIIRETEFNTRMSLLGSILGVGDIYKDMDVHNHPAVQAKLKELDEEVKENPEGIEGDGIADGMTVKDIMKTINELGEIDLEKVGLIDPDTTSPEETLRDEL